MARYTHHLIPVKSRVLEGNPLGDPADRVLHVLAPEDGGAGAPYPVVWLFVGYSGTPQSALEDDPWSEGLQRRIERLTAEGKLGAALFVLPDCFTALGGSQYLNSSATGRYEDHLWTELKPLVEARFRCGRHGAVGRSSGGYGALVQALRHPEIVQAVACHSGDMGFTLCYLPDFPKLASALERNGGVEGFLKAFRATPKKRDGAWLGPMSLLCMAACYSPDPSAPLGIELPFDPATGAIRRDVFSRWLAYDPVAMVEEPLYVERLRKLRLLFLDCGTRDEFHLQWGLRQLVARLRGLDVRVEHEEFDDGHMSVSYRYDVSLPKVVAALGG